MFGFNSQRDGILPRYLAYIAGFKPFQFPTGWNSTKRHRHSKQLRVVSIPNGMEFYALWSCRICDFLQFQFPTGWNSTNYSSGILAATEGFNSQRDGILRSSKGGNANATWVSIPNGMEFYKKHSFILLTFLVSIPNGMEFYDANKITGWAANVFQFPTGWNSTRRKEAYARKFGIVSIPNGMEFYSSYIRSTNSVVLFQFPTGWNSTKKPWNLVECNPVSIPNGMEFYKAESNKETFLKLFQFPTGWNSTLSKKNIDKSGGSFNSQRDGILPLTALRLFLASLSFNSQRDGILLRDSLVLFSQRLRFQFPTGWNSTRHNSVETFDEYSFNSQRDGILLYHAFDTL